MRRQSSNYWLVARSGRSAFATASRSPRRQRAGTWRAVRHFVGATSSWPAPRPFWRKPCAGSPKPMRLSSCVQVLIGTPGSTAAAPANATYRRSRFRSWFRPGGTADFLLVVFPDICGTPNTPGTLLTRSPLLLVDAPLMTDKPGMPVMPSLKRSHERRSLKKAVICTSTFLFWTFQSQHVHFKLTRSQQFISAFLPCRTLNQTLNRSKKY